MKTLWIMCLAFSFVSAQLVAQAASRTDPCNAKPSDGKAFFAFDEFDRELRDAVQHNNTTELALLVQFPLRINYDTGKISINDAAALQSRYVEIFTPNVKRQILETSFKDELTCGWDGVGYGRGAVWVNASARGYAIQVVNADSDVHRNKLGTGRLEYVCQTDTYRIVIDAAAGNAFRYRSWKKPSLLTSRPDLEITKGDQTFEGSDICAVPVYTFKNGTTTYQVDAGMGCGPASDPADATGQLRVTTGGKEILTSWCY